MKLRNKILSAFMAIAASMTFVTISALAADPSITITADKDSVKAGEDITITVAIANNPGVTSFNAEVDADDSLTLASTGAVDAKLFNGSYLYKGSLNPYQLNWNDGTAEENNTANGTIATMTYTVSAKATPGAYPITITSDPGNTMDLDWNEIDFGTATYNVTVVSDAPATKEVGFETTLAYDGVSKGFQFVATNTKTGKTVESEKKALPVIENAAEVKLGCNIVNVPEAEVETVKSVVSMFARWVAELN